MIKSILILRAKMRITYRGCIYDKEKWVYFNFDYLFVFHCYYVIALISDDNIYK